MIAIVAMRLQGYNKGKCKDVKLEKRSEALKEGRQGEGKINQASLVVRTRKRHSPDDFVAKESGSVYFSPRPEILVAVYACIID